MRAALIILVAITSFAAPAFSQTLQPGTTTASSPEVRDRPNQTNAPFVDIFASGAVRDVAANKDNPAAVNGALGLRYRGAVFIVSGLINVASKEDTVRSGFGSSLLPPSSGHALNAGLLDLRAPRLPLNALNAKCSANADAIPCHLGIHVYFSASTARWATSVDAASDKVTASEAVPTWGSGWALSYTFVNGQLVDDNSVAMILDVGLATRSIRGDLGALRDSVRNVLLQTTTKNFAGLEASLNLQYNTIQAGLTYYYMSGTMPGFSKGQIVAGVSLQSTLNSKQLKR